jgi:hypothetical protein
MVLVEMPVVVALVVAGFVLAPADETVCSMAADSLYVLVVAGLVMAGLVPVMVANVWAEIPVDAAVDAMLDTVTEIAVEGSVVVAGFGFEVVADFGFVEVIE